MNYDLKVTMSAKRIVTGQEMAWCLIVFLDNFALVGATYCYKNKNLYLVKSDRNWRKKRHKKHLVQLIHCEIAESSASLYYKYLEKR